MKTIKRKVLPAACVLASVMFVFLALLFFNPKDGGNSDGSGFSETETEILTAPDTGWYTGNPAASSFDIATADQLAGLAVLVNNGNNFKDKTIKLTADINLNGYPNWTPIGNALNRPFLGSFDGNNKKIDNLTITTAQTYSGLFGVVGISTSFGSIKNIRFSNVNISFAPAGSSNYYFGAAAASVEGPTVIESIRVDSGYIGFPKNTGAKVTGRIGGIIGYIDNTTDVTILKCYNKADIVTAFGYVGGIVGAIRGSKIIILNCFNEGRISSTDNLPQSNGGFVGGIAGGIESGSTLIEIKSCYNLENIHDYFQSGKGAAGGILGQNSAGANTKIESCFSAGEISGENPKGLVGKGTGTVIINSYQNHSSKDTNQGTYKDDMMTDPDFAETLGGDFISNAPYGYPSLDGLGIISITFNYNYTLAPQPKIKSIEEGTGLTVADIAVPERTVPNGVASFTGWEDENGIVYTYSLSGELIYENNDPAKFYENTTLYAQWDIRYNITVSFDLNYSGAPQSNPVTKLPAVQGGGITIFASDKPKPNDVTYSAGKRVFLGWSTNALDSSVLYKYNGQGGALVDENGEPVTFDGDITLFAKWEVIENITVSFNLNYSSAPSINPIIKLPEVKDGAITITALDIPKPSDVASSDGKMVFLGWSEVSGDNPQSVLYKYNGQGGALVDSAGEPVEIYENITLFAQWEIIENITISFNLNYTGAPLVNPVTKLPQVKDGAITITALDIPKPNDVINSEGKRVFLGWSEVSGDNPQSVLYSYRGQGGALVDENDEPVEFYENIILYAQWTLIEYVTVSFDYNYDNAPQNKVFSKLPGDVITALDIAMPLRTVSGGKIIFVGWSDDINGNGMVSYEYDINKNINIPVTAGITLYAKWEVTEVTVRFNLNYSAAPSISPITKNVGEFINESELPEPSSRDLGNGVAIFAGWSKTLGGSVEYTYNNGVISIEITEDLLGVTLYAVWDTAGYITVSFDINYPNAEDNIEPISKLDDDQDGEITILLNEMPMLDDRKNSEGLKEAEFKGWSRTKGGSILSTDITVNENTTLYAVWDIISTVTITFNYNYTLNPNPALNVVLEVLPGYSLKQSDIPMLHHIINGGYYEAKFLGWSDTEDGNILGNNEIIGTTVDAVATYYAQWELYYIVIFDYTDDSSMTRKIINEYLGYEITSADVSMPNNIFKEGLVEKVFLGWSNTVDGGILYGYDSGLSIIVIENLTLYAVWDTIEPVTTTFDYGYDSLTKLIRKLPGYKIISADIPNLTDRLNGNFIEYKFLGWSNEEDGDIININLIIGSSITSDTTFYAIWQHYITITFDYNYSLSPADEVLNKISGYNMLSTDIPAVNDRLNNELIAYKFLGWSNTEDGEVIDINLIVGSNITSDTVFYAIWQRYVTITFDYNYNSPFGDVVLNKASGYTIISTDIPTVNDRLSNGLLLYKFLGWSDTEDGNIINIIGNNITSDTVFYAVWQRHINIIFDYNFGLADKPKTITKILGENIAFAEMNVPSRFGAAFIGWNTSKNAQVALYDGDNLEAVLSLDRVTLYAVWEYVSYTIVIDSSANPSGTTVSLNGTSTFTVENIGTISLTITAKGAADYTFYRWHITDGSGNSLFLIPTQDNPLSIIQYFELIKNYADGNDTAKTIYLKAEFLATSSLHTLKIKSNQKAFGYIELNGKEYKEYYNETFIFQKNTDNIELKVIANLYYKITGIKVSGAIISLDADDIFSLPTFTLSGDTEIILEFTEREYTAKVSYRLAKDSSGTDIFDEKELSVKIGDEIQIAYATTEKGYKFASVNEVEKSGASYSNLVFRGEVDFPSGVEMCYLTVTAEFLEDCLNGLELRFLVLYSRQYNFFVNFEDIRMNGYYDDLNVYLTDDFDPLNQSLWDNIELGRTKLYEEGSKIVVELKYDAAYYEFIPGAVDSNVVIIETDLGVILNITLNNDMERILNLIAFTYTVNLKAVWFEGGNGNIVNGVGFSADGIVFNVADNAFELEIEHKGKTGNIDKTDISGFRFIGWRIWNESAGQWESLDFYENDNHNLDSLDYAYLKDYIDGKEIVIIAEYIPVYTLTLKATGAWTHRVEVKKLDSPDFEEIENFNSNQFDNGTAFRITVDYSNYIKFSGFTITNVNKSEITIIEPTENYLYYILEFVLNKATMLNLETDELEDLHQSAVVSFDATPVIKEFKIKQDLTKANGDMNFSSTGAIGQNAVEVGLNDTITFKFNLNSTQVLDLWTINGEKVEDLIKKENISVFYDGSILRFNLDEATLNWLGDNDISIVVATKFDPLLLTAIIGGGIFGLLSLIFIIIISIASIKKQKKIKAAKKAGIIGAARFKVASVIDDALNAEAGKEKKE